MNDKPGLWVRKLPRLSGLPGVAWLKELRGWQRLSGFFKNPFGNAKDRPQYPLRVVWFGLLTAAAFLIPLKILERWVEGRKRHSDYLWDGLSGRLDDPSFIACIAVLLAGFLIMRAYSRLDRMRRVPSEAFRWRLDDLLWKWLLPSFATAWFYLLYVGAIAHQTFFYALKDPVQHWWPDAHSEFRLAKLTIQSLEGLIMLAFIVGGWLFFACGFKALSLVREALDRDVPRHRLERVVGLLASAGLGPAIVVSVFKLFWELVRRFTGQEADWLGTSEFGKLVAVMSLLYLPFVVLGFKIKQLAKYRFCLRRRNLSVGPEFANYAIGSWIIATACQNCDRR